MRSCPGDLSAQYLAGLVRDGVLLDPRRGEISVQKDQLQKLGREIGEKEKKSGKDWLERRVTEARRVEQEWAYADFEATVLKAIPALLPRP